jgi:hypothetical protein
MPEVQDEVVVDPIEQKLIEEVLTSKFGRECGCTSAMEGCVPACERLEGPENVNVECGQAKANRRPVSLSEECSRCPRVEGEGCAGEGCSPE